MNQQPNFYNEQTSGYPPFVPPPPPVKLLPHQRLWRWYRSKKRWARFGIGCLGVFLLCSVCSCGAFAAYVTSPAGQQQIALQQTQTAATSTAQAVTLSSAAQATPTAKPTTRPAAPTFTPTATATSTPTPTAQPTAAPTTAPTQPPPPQPTPTQPPTGVNGNPWGYNFSPGNLIYSPPSNFCDFFNCIASFWNGVGYVIECQDQTYSKSGGRTGSCSRHGGDLRPLYSH